MQTLNLQPYQRAMIEWLESDRPLRLFTGNRRAMSKRMNALMREAIRIQRQEQTVEQAIAKLTKP